MSIVNDGRVALESTLIAHGLPWPDNLETALASEAAVSQAGACPATIAVLDGTIRVGLDRAGLERLARRSTGGPAPIKASRRDLGWAVARKLDAATTVSATLWIARHHGIGVMATGGLGGVHRGAGQTLDISTDLDELARADGCLVVCSGVKSILDIAATLEALETRGVTVIGYQADEFPAFTTVSSGLAVEFRVDSAGEAAEVVRAHRALGVPGAIVMAQPPPADLALDRDEMEEAITAALRMAEVQAVVGKAITPYLLDAIRVQTGERSLIVNKALIVANAGLAGEVARCLMAKS